MSVLKGWTYSARGRSVGADGKVYKEADGSTSLSMGFPVLEISELIPDELAEKAAAEIAALMNKAAAA